MDAASPAWTPAFAGVAELVSTARGQSVEPFCQATHATEHLGRQTTLVHDPPVAPIATQALDSQPP